MPTVTATLEDGRQVQFEADRAPESKEEVEQIIAQHLAAPQEQPKSSAIGAGLRSAATGVIPAAAGAGGFLGGFEAGVPLAPFFGPPAPAVPFVTGAIGAGIASLGASKLQQAGIHAAAPSFEQQQAADVEQHPVASAVGGIAAALPTFEVSPGQSIRGLASVPALLKGTASAAQKRAAAATGVQLGTQAGLTVAQSAITEGKLPSGGQLAEAGISALIYGNPRIKALLPRSVAAAQQATGVKPNASRQQQTAEVHGPVREQPEQGAGQVPVQESGAGVQPEEAKAPVQPVRLTPEEQGHLDTAAKETGRPVKVVSEDDLDPNNAPFAQSVRGKIATIDRKTGTILVNPKEFSAWLTQDVPEADRAAAVRSLISEEHIHLAASDEDSLGYVRSLTGLEKKIGNRVYVGPRGEALDELNLGHEMLRQRMQQLARIPVREAIERSTEETNPWTVKSLLAVGRALQGIRETLGTKASKEGLAILDKVQGNLDAALQAKGVAPAATRKKSQEGQEFMYLPPVKEPQERPTAAEAGAPEYSTKKQLAPHAIGFDEAKGAAFRPVSEAESKSSVALAKFLTEGARKGGSTKNETLTHRVTALFDTLTGRVEVVSTYPHGKEVRMGDPTLLSEDRARPHRPLERLLDRYQPIYSIYLTEPVQNFHERYASMEQFQKELAIPALELAASKFEPGAVSGIDPTAALRPSEVEAPSTGDLGALHDALKPVAGKSAESLRKALTRNPRLITRQGLTALDSMVKAEMISKPNVSAEEAIETTIKKLYDDLTQSKDRNAFIENSVAGFIPRAAQETGQPQAAPPQGAAPATGARELTLRQRRTIPAEPLPEALPARPEPAKQLTAEEAKYLKGQAISQMAAQDFGARHPQVVYRQLANREVPTERYSMGVEKTVQQILEGSPEAQAEAEKYITEGTLFEGSEPAAINKRTMAEARDRTLAEAERLKTAMGNYMTRRDTKDAIPAMQDAADTLANVSGDEAGIRVALSAGAKGTGLKGADRPLESIHTLIAAHAIQSDYNLKTAGPEARKRFGEILRTDPTVAKARSIMKSDPAEAARLVSDAIQDAYQRLVNERLLRADSAKYRFNEKARDAIDPLLRLVDRGEAKAQAALKTGSYQQRAEARDFLKYVPKLRESALWAKANWADPDLRNGALQAKKETDQSFQRQVDSGKVIRYDADYLPGRYEDEYFSENHILFPNRRTLGLRWGEKKNFANYFEAAENGFKAVTLNAAQLVGHSVRQAEGSINKGRWLDTIQSTPDPVTGLPIAREPDIGPDGKPKVPSYDYELVPIGGKFLAVHNGYSGLLKALTSKSAVQEFPPARIALEMAQRLKHTLLVGDLFHLAREAYYGQAIAGLGRLAGFKQGLAAIQLRPEDLARAVDQGFISKKQAEWASQTIPVKQGTKVYDMTRREVAMKMMERGLNVGQIQDALYLDLTRGIPVIGPLVQKYNRLLFYRFTRGIMMESAVHEFERLNAKHPNIDAEVLMRDIARDTNRFFGSIGRQGWFKSRTWQDLSRLALLAPQWVEGLVMKEAALPKRTVGAGLSAVGLPGGRAGLPKLGTLAGGISGGLMTMLAITQAINLITTYFGKGKAVPTWLNDDPNHKWDAWIPGGKNGFWLSPLAVFNELTHDLVRLFQSKPKAWDALQQIGENKLGPFGHMALVLATDKSPRGEYQTTSAGVMKEAGKSILPVPISFGTVGREGASRIAPGLVSPPPEGSTERQMLQWVGLKAEPGMGAAQRIGRMAQQFNQVSGKAGPGFNFQPTDDPSYAKLRSALRNGDSKTAGAVLQELQKTRPMQKIGEAVKLWAHKPFTGSKKMEQRFIASLTPQERELYSQAMVEKEKEFQKFIEFVLKAR